MAMGMTGQDPVAVLGIGAMGHVLRVLEHHRASLVLHGTGGPCPCSVDIETTQTPERIDRELEGDARRNDQRLIPAPCVAAIGPSQLQWLEAWPGLGGV